MRKTYLLFGILVGLLLTTMPAISAVEYNTAKTYTTEQLQNMDIQDVLELVKEKLDDREPDGLITIAAYLLYALAKSLVYIVPAFVYFLITVIL